MIATDSCFNLLIPIPIVIIAEAGSCYYNKELAIDIAIHINKNCNNLFEKRSWNAKGDCDSDKKQIEYPLWYSVGLFYFVFLS